MWDLSAREFANNLPALCWIAQPDGYIAWYNKRWYEFTGATVEEMEGWGWQSVHKPEELPGVLERWRGSISSGEPFEMVFPLRKFDGTFTPFLTRVNPARNESGEITAWYGVNTEITEQVQAEDALALLANELSHRIKNIFAVVSGLISFSARSVPACREFSFELSKRIAALGKAHDFIRPHNASSSKLIATSMFDLIHQLLAPYQRDERILITGKDLQVNERATMSLALLFHELATNSTKYGSLSTAEGLVEISTEVTETALKINWEEKRGPPVATPMSLGFGSNLTRISIEAQLSGRITYDWKPKGLIVCASIPLEAVLP
ncbi:PAS domain S-box protein [Tardiphaga sp. vice304]|uniref:HWE histidine kinase domain-containing protein n=1 Tax=Tardiphaga sp. vice304 TaxID=2592817 RepID=UPI0011646043|nr:HWE histidine kinase domain-containing protein [Tardiphaga sp. vice304]QDM28387.1 PAS domain S-box protein [Tardiphaga sp. vice304]